VVVTKSIGKKIRGKALVPESDQDIKNEAFLARLTRLMALHLSLGRARGFIL
jgi:hypothetical protein